MARLADIAPVLRAAGLTVVELPGWKTRTRPGPHAPKGFLAHHTAGSSDSRSYVEWMTYTGRPSEGIPGPLAQIALSRTGIVYLCAAGRANHAGKCRAIGNWLQAGDGNTQLVGCEALHRGGTEPWTATQYKAYVLLAATVCKFMGWPASHALGHKETSLTGKPDPTFNMTTFRANVARAMAGSPKPEPTPQEDDSMFISKYGASRFRLFADRVYGISEGTFNMFRDGGVPVKVLSNVAIAGLEIVLNGAEEEDDAAIAELDAKLDAVLLQLNEDAQPDPS